MKAIKILALLSLIFCIASCSPNNVSSSSNNSFTSSNNSIDEELSSYYQELFQEFNQKYRDLYYVLTTGAYQCEKTYTYSEDKEIYKYAKSPFYYEVDKPSENKKVYQEEDDHIYLYEYLHGSILCKDYFCEADNSNYVKTVRPLHYLFLSFEYPNATIEKNGDIYTINTSYNEYYNDSLDKDLVSLINHGNVYDGKLILEYSFDSNNLVVKIFSGNCYISYSFTNGIEKDDVQNKVQIGMHIDEVTKESDYSTPIIYPGNYKNFVCTKGYLKKGIYRMVTKDSSSPVGVCVYDENQQSLKMELKDYAYIPSNVFIVPSDGLYYLEMSMISEKNEQEVIIEDISDICQFDYFNPIDLKSGMKMCFLSKYDRHYYFYDAPEDQILRIYNDTEYQIFATRKSVETSNKFDAIFYLSPGDNYVDVKKGMNYIFLEPQNILDDKLYPISYNFQVEIMNFEFCFEKDYDKLDEITEELSEKAYFSGRGIQPQYLALNVEKYGIYDLKSIPVASNVYGNSFDVYRVEDDKYMDRHIYGYLLEPGRYYVCIYDPSHICAYGKVYYEYYSLEDKDVEVELPTVIPSEGINQLNSIPDQRYDESQNVKYWFTLDSEENIVFETRVNIYDENGCLLSKFTYPDYTYYADNITLKAGRYYYTYKEGEYVNRPVLVAKTSFKTDNHFYSSGFDTKFTIGEEYTIKRDGTLDIENFCIEINEETEYFIYSAYHGNLVIYDENYNIVLQKAIKANYGESFNPFIVYKVNLKPGKYLCKYFYGGYFTSLDSTIECPVEYKFIISKERIWTNS